MKAKIILTTALSFVCLIVAAEPATSVQSSAKTESVTITVGAQPRQTFKGLGVSAWGGGDYLQLASGRRAKLNNLVWCDARFNTMRLWLHLKSYAPASGQRRFQEAFPDGDATLVRDAQTAGMKHLVLGPCDVPDYLIKRLPLTAHDGKGPGAPHLRSDQLKEHATIIADFIHELWEKGHIAIEATGIQNEPNDITDCQFTPEEMVQSVTLLRAALDFRGLQQVKIIAPETVGCGGTWLWLNHRVTLVNDITPETGGEALAYAMVDALKAAPSAWSALGGIATHSYDGGASERMADIIAGTDKDYWMTEFCVGGPEEPGDYFRASAEATTFLSDMNHRVSYWIHFIGYLSDDPHDNGTRLIAYYDGNVPDNEWIKIFEPYYYLKQLSQTFDVGAVFRQSVSPMPEGMTWTHDNKPGLVVAVARNPDGSWGIGLSNFTSDHFPPDFWFRGKPAQSFEVTIKVDALANAGEVRFETRRSGPQSGNSHQEPAIIMRNGQLTLMIDPLELVTLRSR